jgi:DNA-binding transcriptional MerR regulator
MNYSISQTAQRIGVTAYTLRYYDKEGLLPFVDRTPSGIRSFKESDFEWLAVVNCLKNTGMSIKQIKVFIDYCLEGDATLEKRLDVFTNQKASVEKQIEELQTYLKKIEYKIWYYQTAVAAGTEAVHAKGKCESEFEKMDQQ